jgi:hypothetical protein
MKGLWTAILAFFLALAPTCAWAALDISVGGLLHLLLYIIVIIIIFAIVWYVMDYLAIREPFNHWIRVAIVVIGAIILIVFLLNFVGAVNFR